MNFHHSLYIIKAWYIYIYIYVYFFLLFFLLVNQTKIFSLFFLYIYLFLYFIVLGDYAWMCLHVSVDESHSVKLCIKWKIEYWNSMCNLIIYLFIFYLQYLKKKWKKVVFTIISLYKRSFIYFFIPCVCHSYFAYVVRLVSITSCLITFMLVYGFFVPLWLSLCFPSETL